METVTLGDGYQHEATRCIDSALSQDCWALIHGLHLAPEKLVRVHLVINFCNRTEALHFFVHASISTACTVTLRLLGSNLTLVDLLIGVCVH